MTLILDEFGNLGRIPHFETTIAVARGRGVGVGGRRPVARPARGASTGAATRQTIRACCSTRLTLGGGLDPETAQWFATLSGEATVVIETESRRPERAGLAGGGDEVSRSQQHVRRTLLTADEVRRLPQGRCWRSWPTGRRCGCRRFWHDAPACPGRAPALGPERGLAFDAPPPRPSGPPGLDALPEPPAWEGGV